MLRQTAILAFAATCVSGASAGSVNIQTDFGVNYETSGFTRFATTGDRMTGMSLTANFVGGGSETVVWSGASEGMGVASGTGWSLEQAGDTFFGLWTLASDGAAISSLTLDAGTGNSVFDRTFGGLTGTEGSQDGADFAVLLGGAELDIMATYRDAIMVTGDETIGDTWRTLELSFLGDGGFSEGEIIFRQDTDNLADGGELSVVPLPAPAMLASVGIGAMVIRRRR